MKIMTLGSGFIADHLPYEKITERIQLQWYEAKRILSSYRPDVLINCLGRTGRPNIDWCEKHKEETAEANVSLAIMVAEICQKLSIHFIHMSSGCIFFGSSPHVDLASGIDTGWTEEDFANPKSFYSKTKYASDLVLSQMPHVGLLRIRMPISDQDSSRNILNKLRSYSQIIDIPNSVTFMDDLVKCIDWAAHRKIHGVYHVANPQPLTAVDMMKEYQKYVPEHQFEIINEQQLDALTIAKRSNCILNTDKLQNAGFKMSDTGEMLSICMKKYIENIRRNNV